MERPSFWPGLVRLLLFLFYQVAITNGHISLSAYVLMGFGLLDFLNRWGLDRILRESLWKYIGGGDFGRFALRAILLPSAERWRLRRGCFGTHSASLRPGSEPVPFRKAAFQERSVGILMF
jgi:hypothetical protein